MICLIPFLIAVCISAARKSNVVTCKRSGTRRSERLLHPNKKLQWFTGTSRFLEHKPSLNPGEISKKSKIWQFFFWIYPGLCYTLFSLCCRGWLKFSQKAQGIQLPGLPQPAAPGTRRDPARRDEATRIHPRDQPCLGSVSHPARGSSRIRMLRKEYKNRTSK